MLGAHVIGFCEKGTVNNLSRVAPLADRMDVNDFKFLRSPYAIDSAWSSVSSRVQRSSPERHSPERTEATPTPIPEGPGEVQHAGSAPHTGTSPQSEGHTAGAAVTSLEQTLTSWGVGSPLQLTSVVQKSIRIGRMWRLRRCGTISSGVHRSRQMQKRRRASRRSIALLLAHLGVQATQM